MTRSETKMSRAEKKAVLLPILAPSPQEARLTLGVPAGQVGPQRVTLISAVAKSHLSTRLICSPPFIRVLLLSAFAIYFNLKSRLHSTGCPKKEFCQLWYLGRAFGRAKYGQVTLKRSCKMQFRRVDLVLIGPSTPCSQLL